MRYRVTAPFINAEVPSRAVDAGPYRISGQTAFHRDAILPPDVPRDLLDRLLAAGMIAEEPA